MGRKMERSRSISLALIALSLTVGANAGYVLELSASDYIFLAMLLMTPHLIGLLVSRFKKIQNISPLLSIITATALLLFRIGDSKFEKMIPTLSNLNNILKQGQDGLVQFRDNALPITSNMSTIIVVGFVVWSIAELIETLALRMEMYGTALLCYITFYTLSIEISPTGFNPISAGIFCFLIWVYLRIIYKTKISHLAHRISVEAKTKIWSYLKSPLMALLVLGLSLLLVIPITLPTLTSRGIVSTLKSKSTKTKLSPLVSMRAQLKDDENTLLFTAKTDSAQYFRIGVLNRFDGEAWYHQPSSKDNIEPKIVNRDTKKVKASFNLINLDPEFLPTVYKTDSTSNKNLEITSDSVVYSKNKNINSYEISASVPSETLNEEQIKNSSYQTPKTLDENLLIPVDFDEDKKIESLARSIAANKQSRYEQVLALRDYFTSGDFRYSTKVDYTSSEDSMNDFLDKKIGFCEQYAATYAAMARLIRIPARIVVGFTPGKPDENGVFSIRSKQAHSWVEVYLAWTGWVTIDPTPQGNSPGQAPANIGEIVPTTTSTTVPLADTKPLQSDDTINTITKTKVENSPQNKTTKDILDNKYIILIITLLILISLISLYRFKKKKEKKFSNSNKFLIDIFMTISDYYNHDRSNRNTSIEDLKKIIPKMNYYTHKYLDQYSEYLYSPDSKIDRVQLEETANMVKEEMAQVLSESK